MPLSKIPILKSTKIPSKGMLKNKVKPGTSTAGSIRSTKSVAPLELGARSKSAITCSSTQFLDRVDVKLLAKPITRPFTKSLKNSTKHQVTAGAAKVSKKAVADRRGISEIKRSETELAAQVSSLNDQVFKLEQQLHSAAEKDDTIKNLTIQVNKLENMVEDLMVQLEESNINPVSLKPFENSQAVFTEAERAKQEEVDYIDELALDLSATVKSLEHNYEDLNNLINTL